MMIRTAMLTPARRLLIETLVEYGGALHNADGHVTRDLQQLMEVNGYEGSRDSVSSICNGMAKQDLLDYDSRMDRRVYAVSLTRGTLLWLKAKGDEALAIRVSDVLEGMRMLRGQGPAEDATVMHPSMREVEVRAEAEELSPIFHLPLPGQGDYDQGEPESNVEATLNIGGIDPAVSILLEASLEIDDPKPLIRMALEKLS